MPVSDMPDASAGSFGFLRNPDARLFLVSRFLWVAATQIVNVAVGWTVYEVTQSAWSLGLVGLIAFAPRLPLMLFSGIMADRHDRRIIMASGLAINAAVTLLLLIVVTGGQVRIGFIYALYLVLGAVRGFVGPAAQAMAGNVVPRQQLGRLMGFSSSVGQIATVAGPALGGMLYVAGTALPFACAAAFYAVAAIANIFIRRRNDSTDRPPAGWREALAGLGFIRRHPVILGAISLDMFSVLLGGATALLPIITVELLHAGPSVLGILRAMPAVGAAMVGILLGRFPIQRNAGRKLFIATTVFGLATIALGLSHNLWLTFAILWLLGASDVFSVVIRQTLVQAETPDNMRGRVSAVNAVFIGASNELGEFESGATAALFGLVPAIVLGGAGTLAVVAIWATVFPDLRKRDWLIDPKSG
ncbi:MFS transporter [Paracoccus pacificus]|uniref:Multidrug efflux pump Tap n=1 Tax=Paracoccus pacificus TaxID=1463598 RepID=A0ABW4R1N3_9RHOB